MDRVGSTRRLLVVFVIVLALAVLAPVAVWAQAPIWHTDQLIEDNAGRDGDYPQVAMSGANAVAVWSQSDGSSRRIHSNYSTDCGATWHDDQLIENNGGRNGYGPQVAMSGANVVAVWQQSDGSRERIYSNYSTDGGATWHDDQLIENNAGFDGDSPQVAISGANVVAVWRQFDGGAFRIYSNCSTDGGATWQGDQLIEDNIGNSALGPQVAMSGPDVVAVWQQFVGGRYRIHSNCSTDGGAIWQGDQLIEDNVGRNGWWPQVAMSNSRAVAVWLQHDGGNFRIYSNYSTDSGATWHTDQLIEDNVGFDGDRPQVAMSGANAVAVWYQVDGGVNRVYSNYSTDGGATWGADQLIEDNAGLGGGNPQVAMCGARAVAVWYQNDGSGMIRIYSNHSTDGGATWGADQLIEDNVGCDGWEPQVAMSTCSAVAVWYQWDGNNWRIYSNWATFPSAPKAVPALSQWGVIGLTALFGTALTFVLWRRRPSRQS